MNHKIFITVSQDSDGRQTFRHIEAQQVFEIAGEQFKFQSEFFVKHSKAGECAIISDVVVFCQVG